MSTQQKEQADAAKTHDEPTDLAEQEQIASFQRFAQPLPAPRADKPQLPAKLPAQPPQRKESRKEHRTFLIDQESGLLEISASVVAAIVREEGPKVDGVIDILGRSLRYKLKKLFATGRIADGVYVEKNDNLLHMEVTLAVRYGVNIPAVADEIRTRLAEKIEQITGYRVVTISVIVDRIVVQDKPPQVADKPAGDQLAS